MKLDGFDYIDFGGLTTRGENIAATKFKGAKGLVITDDPDIAAAARAMGSMVGAGDAASIKALEGKVGFVLIGNLLERSGSFSEVCRIVNTAVGLSRSFVYIQTPWFDSDGDLLRQGLKLHWSDWTAHTMPLTSLQLLRAIQPMLRKQAVARAVIYREGAITSTDDPRILPRDAGRNSGRYKAEAHGAKPDVALAGPAYTHLIGLIARRDAAIVEGAMVKIRNVEAIFDSAAAGAVATTAPRAGSPTPTAKASISSAAKPAPTAPSRVRTRTAPRVRG